MNAKRATSERRRRKKKNRLEADAINLSFVHILLCASDTPLCLCLARHEVPKWMISWYCRVNDVRMCWLSPWEMVVWCCWCFHDFHFFLNTVRRHLQMLAIHLSQNHSVSRFQDINYKVWTRKNWQRSIYILVHSTNTRSTILRSQSARRMASCMLNQHWNL